MADWTTLKYAVVDVEGNGHQPPDLVELAVVPIVGGVIGEPEEWLIQPDRPITDFARRIHGITNAEVEGADTFVDIADAVRKSLKVDAIVAHNAHIDVGVLQRKLGEWAVPEVFDTLKLARRLLPDAGSHKLGKLVEAFKLDEGLSESPDSVPHRAGYDALVTARLFVRLATSPDTRSLSLEELRGVSPGGDEDETPALF
ncbi:3'-5' exonuclease [Actinosynnema sp. NPDC023587]|uniref:3'-5' exonuclease n=1 Tax=Actinosynnema sp. NPDC023587 TaxID=3154695 RepID=UPI0033D7389B